jgi:ferritin-like protein
MNKPTDMGANRTGMGTSPVDGMRTVQGAEEESTTAPIEGIAMLRETYMREAETVGTMPPPATMKGVAKAAVGMVAGTNPNVLLDKLGERAAFERSGTRLYEALLTRYEALGGWSGGPTRERILEIAAQELEHYRLVATAIVRLGGDPTAMTPGADVVGVASMGLVQVLTDPRMTLDQCLCAILTAEATDVASWELLVTLAQGVGQEDLAAEFSQALLHEVTHLSDVKQCLAAFASQEAASRPGAQMQASAK